MVGLKTAGPSAKKSIFEDYSFEKSILLTAIGLKSINILACSNLTLLAFELRLS